MKHQGIRKAMLLAGGLLAASAAHSSLMYSIENGSTPQNVLAIEGPTSAADYYNYYSASGHPGFGTESNTGFFWLYENLSDHSISLGMIFDTVNDGSGGNVKFTTSGMPGTATVAVADDGSEQATLINGTETWKWVGCCTDGAVISGLNGTWDITFDLVSSTGIDNWVFLSGPDDGSLDRISLDFGSNLTIHARAVPEPASVALLMVGIAGLGLRRFRKA